MKNIHGYPGGQKKSADIQGVDDSKKGYPQQKVGVRIFFWKSPIRVHMQITKCIFDEIIYLFRENRTFFLLNRVGEIH